MAKVTVPNKKVLRAAISFSLEFAIVESCRP
jgi:hypothetical protein